MRTRSNALVLSSEQCERLRRHPLTNQLHPTHIGISLNNKGETRRKHGCDTHILILCVDGLGFIRTPSKNAVVPPGHLLLIPAGEEHSYGRAGDQHWSIYWTHFSGEMASQFFRLESNDVLLDPVPESLFNDALSIFLNLLSTLTSDIQINNLVLASQQLRHLLARLFFTSSNEATIVYGGTAIEKAIDFMASNITNSLSLEEIASKAGLSKTHFSHIFKKETGFTPIGYFNNLKIRRACLLLDASSKRIGEISEEIGMDNRHYFSRLFGKVMGMSPMNYRKRKNWGVNT